MVSNIVLQKAYLQNTVYYSCYYITQAELPQYIAYSCQLVHIIPVLTSDNLKKLKLTFRHVLQHIYIHTTEPIYVHNIIS
jgi:hypothetical protein